jgi:hypothetical protein
MRQHFGGLVLTSASACTLREKRKAQATESAWAAKSLAELRAIK